MGLKIVESKGILTPLDTYYLWHGVKYVGKSSWFSMYPNTLYITTEEKRLNHIKGIKWIYVRNWRELLKVTEYLNSDRARSRFQFIVIDVVDMTFSFCEYYVCDENKWDSIISPGWGKGERALDAEYRKWYVNLLTLPYGFAFISHTKVLNVEKVVKEGGKLITVMKPKVQSGLSDRAKAIILPPIAITGHMKFEDIIQNNKYYKNVRVVSFEGSDLIEAGDGLGIMPKRIIVPNDVSKIYPMMEGYFSKGKEIV